MPAWRWALLGLGVAVVLWGALVAALVLLGRRAAAVDVARLVPDCVVLFRRLMRDPHRNS